MKWVSATIMGAAMLISGAAGAVPYTLMFERDDDAGAGQELVFRSYASYGDLSNNLNATDVFSPINIASNFSTTGLTWDGSRYLLMFERDDDAGAGQELVFRSYTTYENLINNLNGSDFFSPINISANFSTTGLTWDGSRYLLMFERDDDAAAGQELVFRSYATYDDLINNLNGADFFSPINISANFSTTGLTWDGSQYLLMFERDDDVGGGQELAFRSYATYDDLINNLNGSDVFSPINIAGNFSTRGLMALVDWADPPNPVSLPSTLTLLVAACLSALGHAALTRIASPDARP